MRSLGISVGAAVRAAVAMTAGDWIWATLALGCGEPFESTLGDILTHLPIHGQHHRGQIAAHLRASGSVPPVIDFIHAARGGQLGVTS